MERTELLDRYRGGYAAVEEAMAGITDEELDRPGPDGGWSARQVAHHLADSEATAFVRLRRLIAEDEPTIVGYDEPEYARRLHYDRPVGSSLAVLRAVRSRASSSWSRSLRPSGIGAGRTPSPARTRWTTGSGSMQPTRTITRRRSVPRARARP